MSIRALWEIELIAGLGSALFGIVIPTYFTFFAGTPLSTEVGAGAAVILIYAMVLGVAIGAILHSLYHGLGFGATIVGLALLWTSAVTLIMFAMVEPSHVGVHLLPATILALISSVAGTWAQIEVGHVGPTR